MIVVDPEIFASEPLQISPNVFNFGANVKKVHSIYFAVEIGHIFQYIWYIDMVNIGLLENQSGEKDGIVDSWSCIYSYDFKLLWIYGKNMCICLFCLIQPC